MNAIKFKDLDQQLPFDEFNLVYKQLISILYQLLLIEVMKSFLLIPYHPYSKNLSRTFQKVTYDSAIKKRLQRFDILKEKHNDLLNKAPSYQINIKTRGLSVINGISFKTTPHQVALKAYKKIPSHCVAAKIKYSKRYSSPFGGKPINLDLQFGNNNFGQYQLIDLKCPIQGDCQIEFIDTEHQLGKHVLWHSSSHILGYGIQNLYGGWLCHGPSIQNGFFYDYFAGKQTFSYVRQEVLQKQIHNILEKQKQFQKIILSKQQALQMFEYNPFKKYLIETKIENGGITSVYRCGSFIDLCVGPHITTTQNIKAFKIIKHSSSYWLGNKQNQALQRIYGISFSKKSELQEYIKQQDLIKKNDHRVIGNSQKLFKFSQFAAGSAFLLPHGTIIYNRLIELMRSQYKIRGYDEVISPNLYNARLWKISGHYFKYKQHMIFTNKQEEEEEEGLKPMNCPGHCLIFNQTQYSYRDLPIRMADFGVLHREQLAGSLSGLTRVRRFQQDDGHIFCRNDQVEEEILGILDLLDYIYHLFGFKYSLELSTRPATYLGTLDEWNHAQNQLKSALVKFGNAYQLNEGDGAFYGPKIDIKLLDALGRKHQCGTVQLDFQLPQRFNLQYRSKQSGDKKDEFTEESEGENANGDSKQENIAHHASQQQKYAVLKPLKKGFMRPVIIHRAIFGSLERFIAILCQHTGGKWDFWISPRQIKLICIGKDAIQYATKIYNKLQLKGYSVEIDISDQSLNKKIRKSQLEGFNFIGVVGRQEQKTKKISLRQRQNAKQYKNVSIDQMFAIFQRLKVTKSKKRINLQKKCSDSQI